MKKIFLIFITSVLGYSAFAQKAKLDNADCENAINLGDSLPQPFVSIGGHGEIQEMWGDKTESNIFFQKEENSSWYTLVAPYSAQLSFEIIPENSESDIDFLLFEAVDNNVCEMILNKEIKPLRTNIARADGGNGSKTGLSNQGTSDYVGPGFGNNFSFPLKVDRGSEYILLLNNLSADELGHKIIVHLKKLEEQVGEIALTNMPKYQINEVETKSTVVGHKDAGVSLKVNVVDSKEGQPINVDLEVDGIIPGKSVIVENKHSFTYILEKRKHYQVKCIYQGFMLYSEELVAPDQAEKINLNITLDPITKGAKVALHNITFKPNGDYILRASESELQALVKFMEKNPTAEIKINGHVNGPKLDNTSELKKLSRSRAKAVYDYLIEHDISKKRLKFEGLGNSEMLYPIPITHDQEKANRRVEIEILEY